MKGDFSRHTFDPAKHYSSVRMQQGRVQLDADWNEQADLTRHRSEAATADVVGACGAPVEEAGFEVSVSGADLEPGDFVIGPGRYYVDGALCECERPVRYLAQPDLPRPTPVEACEPGLTLVYLDVWQRHLTWLDDPMLRETALGGPDTATRTKTVWQVRTLPLTGEVECGKDPAEYLAAITPGTGTLRARAQPEDVDPDPCIVPAEAGYRGLENQLYRVEVHAPGAATGVASGDGTAVSLVGDRVVYEGGSWAVGDWVEIFRSAPGSDPAAGWLARIVDRDAASRTLVLGAALPELGVEDAPRMRAVGATYKWSRDNGSVVAPVASVVDREVVLAGLPGGVEERLRAGGWVELVDAAAELEARPGFLAQLAGYDPTTRTATLRDAPPSGEGLKLRHWDGVGAVETGSPEAEGIFLGLEDGVEVGFTPGTYLTGDYWQIPARTATAEARSGRIEWPLEAGEPQAQAPRGIEHRYCKLAIVRRDGKGLVEVRDCRRLFPPLSGLETLLYVGGDGQEAAPGEALPQPLEAGVFRGPLPVRDARVVFEADPGGGLARLGEDPAAAGEARLAVRTGADGVAACLWLPAADPEEPSRRVEARLLDREGAELAPRLDYNAQLRPPSAGSCCCARVEPGESIAARVEELLGRDALAICLCLEAGEHEIESLELPRGATVTLAGCGPLTRLAARELRFRRLEAVTLRDLELVMHGEPVRFEGCGAVALERCRIRRGRGVGLVCAATEGERVRIEACKLDAGDSEDPESPALALGDGIDSLIEATEIRGTLVLYGTDPPAKALSARSLATLSKGVQAHDVDPVGSGSLHLHASSLARIELDRQRLEELQGMDRVPCYDRIHLTDLRMLLGHSLVFADRLTLTAVDFDAEGRVAYGIARTAIATACRAPGKSSLHLLAWQSDEAANLLAVET